MEIKKHIIRISFIFLWLLLWMVSYPQRYFLCDSVVLINQDSISITSKCPYIFKLENYPCNTFDTIFYTSSEGYGILDSVTIIYKCRLKNNKGLYKIIRDGKIIQECNFTNYSPDGWYKSYFPIPNNKSQITKKMHFKKGLKDGISVYYSFKSNKKILIEHYRDGILVKRIQKFETW
jgi:hypothetical protein